MKLFEFEAKEILRRCGLATPKGSVAGSPDEAVAIARELGRARGPQGAGAGGGAGQGRRDCLRG